LDQEISPFTKALKRHLNKEFGFSKTDTVGLTNIKDINILESMMQLIRDCEFMVCCFTKDQKISKTEFVTKPSIYMEFAMAKILNKPTLTFVEEGVKIYTLVQVSTQYIEISRENLMNIEKYGNDKITEFKVKTKSLVLNSIKQDVLEYYRNNK